MITYVPCFSLTKPQSFADCVGDELPLGWEQVIDYSRGVYYINHVESKYLLDQVFALPVRYLRYGITR